MWYAQEIEIVDGVPFVDKRVTSLFKGENWELQSIVYKELRKRKIVSYGTINSNIITIIV